MKNYAMLIAGLGNPGAEYDRTRHNFGFMLVDRLMERAGGPGKCPSVALRGDCLTHECQPLRSLPKLLLAKPQTYMNLSGVAVGKLASKFALTMDQVLVVHDDLDLELGRMKLKKGGGDAGHNGIKSIAEHLGGAGFLRLRLGIGRPAARGGGRDYVLDPFTDDEEPVLAEVLDGAVKGIHILLRKGFSFAVQYVNGFDARPSEVSPRET